jgi:tetratricopeptide (TPR) repeat protein
MTRLTVAILLLAAAACAPQRSSRGAALERGHAALRAGDTSAALREADEALKHVAADDNSVASWRLRLLRAETLITRRELHAAEAALAPPVPDTAGLAGVRARHRYLEGRFVLAGNDLPRAIAIFSDARGMAVHDPEVQIDSGLFEGQARAQRREWDVAEATLNAALALATAQRDTYRQLLCLNNLGMSRLLRARYDEALVFFERALRLPAIAQTAGYALVLSNAGICYARLGQFEQALAVQERAVAAQRTRGPSKALAEALGSLGNTHVLRGDPRRALPFLNDAFAVAAAASTQGDAAVWAVNLGAAHALLGEWDDAERFNEWSRGVAGGTGVRQIYSDMTAADIAVGRGDRQRARTLYESALKAADGVAAVEWTAYAGLAQIAVLDRQPAVAARHFEAALRTVERTRSDLLKVDYKLSFLTQLIEFYRNYVDALVAQGQPERALEIAESSRGRVLAERQRVEAPTRVGADALRELARSSGTVLLSYWLAPRRSFLWIVSASGIRQVELPSEPEIAAAVRDYQSMIANALADPLASAGTPGDRLFKMLVAPAALARGTPVIIVPDSALYAVNFETLPVDGPHRHYFIEDAEVQVAPSLSMLRARAGRTSADPRLLLIGNPTPRTKFPALRFAKAEMNSIRRHFSPAQVTEYAEQRATPAVYREAALDRYSIVHFTAHATANVESPLESAVVLSGPDTGYKLYARDVADRPLNADLVTVSACRSAGERTFSGEGLVGFAWAFLRAGARRVVAGLWDVDDRSTARLMDGLYGNLFAGATPSRALRDAKLALIHEGGELARPYYWGPFQLFTVVP